MKSKTTTSVVLEEADHAELVALAESRGESVSAIVRAALQTYLRRHGRR